MNMKGKGRAGQAGSWQCESSGRGAEARPVTRGFCSAHPAGVQPQTWKNRKKLCLNGSALSKLCDLISAAPLYELDLLSVCSCVDVFSIEKGSLGRTFEPRAFLSA